MKKYSQSLTYRNSVCFLNIIQTAQVKIQVKLWVNSFVFNACLFSQKNTLSQVVPESTSHWTSLLADLTLHDIYQLLRKIRSTLVWKVAWKAGGAVRDCKCANSERLWLTVDFLLFWGWQSQLKLRKSRGRWSRPLFSFVGLILHLPKRVVTTLQFWPQCFITDKDMKEWLGCIYSSWRRSCLHSFLVHHHCV